MKIKLPFKKVGRYLGIDIGATSIKIVEVNKKNGRFEVVRADLLDVPQTQTPEEKNKNITTILKNYIQSNKKITRDVVTTISGQTAIVRYIKIPVTVPQNELKDAVTNIAVEQIPFPVDNAVIDFAITGEVIEEGMKKYDIVFAAARKDTINAEIELLAKAGLNVLAVDVDAFAIENVVNYLNPEKNECTLVVDIGYSTTVISVVDSGITRITREIQQGGVNLTKALQRNLQCDEKKAEELKSKIGLILDPNEKIKLQSEGNREALQVSTILSMELKTIIDETSRIMYFYLSQYSQKTINKIYITGGVSALKNLPELFTQQLHSETLTLNPFANMEGEEKIDETKKLNFAVATGCALRYYI